MSNSTNLPVRRVRTISVYNEVAEAPSTDFENAQDYEAYEGYEAYDGYATRVGSEGEDEYEGYDGYEQPQRSGLFSSPARALALGGSVVALLVVFAVAIFIANGPGTTRPPVPTGVTDVALISRIADTGGTTEGSVPIDFEWTDANGEKVSLASLKGKPVWINFWATWCYPCRMEMPAMQKVYTKHKDDLVILGVSMSPRDSPGLVSEFLKQNTYEWTFIHDEEQALAVKYRAGSIPMSYFIGADGTIKARSVGAIPENMMEDFIAKAKQ